jgi:hypothetical protein
MDHRAAYEHVGVAIPADIVAVGDPEMGEPEERFRHLGKRILALPVQAERRLMRNGMSCGRETIVSVAVGDNFSIDITATEGYDAPGRSYRNFSAVRAIWTYQDSTRLPVEELDKYSLHGSEETLTLLEQTVTEAEHAFVEVHRKARVVSAVSIAG